MLNATTILLEPLSPEECAELIERHGGVDPEAGGRILATAEGNPLFLEEMVAFLREGGGLSVPATVQALLQARLDQLERGERSVIERGSVEGQVFHRGAVLELTQATDLESQLTGLVRKELIRPAVATFAGEYAFQFRHLLIRDAAYDGLPKETRAELHERFATWLEVTGRELIELDEVLGYHLEQAARYRDELGRGSEELAERAGLRLWSAGLRAGSRGDLPAATNLLGRARALLPPGPEQERVTIELLFALEAAGETELRPTLVAELEASEDQNLAMHGRLGRSQLRINVDPYDAVPEAEEAVTEALSLYVEDDVMLAHAYGVSTWVHWLQSQALDTVAANERMQQAAARCGLSQLAIRADVIELGPLHHGPFTPTEIRERAEQFQRVDSAVARRAAHFIDAHLAWIDGHFSEAHAHLDQAEALTADLGLDMMAIIGIGSSRAEILLSENRLEEAIDTYNKVEALLSEAGHTSFRSTVLINLAQAHYRNGNSREAERLALEGEQLGASEDIVNHAWGPALRAMIAADRNHPELAEQLARSGLEHAYRTDFPAVQTDCHQALAHVLTVAGKLNEARVELNHALDLSLRYRRTAEAELIRNTIEQL